MLSPCRKCSIRNEESCSSDALQPITLARYTRPASERSDVARMQGIENLALSKRKQLARVMLSCLWYACTFSACTSTHHTAGNRSHSDLARSAQPFQAGYRIDHPTGVVLVGFTPSGLAFQQHGTIRLLKSLGISGLGVKQVSVFWNARSYEQNTVEHLAPDYEMERSIHCKLLPLNPWLVLECKESSWGGAHPSFLTTRRLISPYQLKVTGICKFVRQPSHGDKIVVGANSIRVPELGKLALHSIYEKSATCREARLSEENLRCNFIRWSAGGVVVEAVAEPAHALRALCDAVHAEILLPANSMKVASTLKHEHEHAASVSMMSLE